MQELYEVQYCKQKNRVWVHSLKGETVARFDTRFGMDIHCSLEEQMQGKHQCLLCTHEKPNRETFNMFCQKVKQLFGVKIIKNKIAI